MSLGSQVTPSPSLTPGWLDFLKSTHSSPILHKHLAVDVKDSLCPSPFSIFLGEPSQPLLPCPTSTKTKENQERTCAPNQTQAQTMKDAPLAVKMFTPTKGEWTDLLNSNWERSSWMAGLCAQPQAPLPRMGPCQRGMRGMGPAAAHEGGTTVTPIEGLLENSNLERKPRAEIAQMGQRKRLGRWQAGRGGLRSPP